jgi:hypothetical protein
MPKSTFLFLLISVFIFNQYYFSQDLRKKAEENPLSTIFYLLSITDKNSKEEEKACLSKSFAKVNKYHESEKTAKMFIDGGYADDNLILVINTFIENKRTKEASDFASYLLQRFENDAYKLRHLWKSLVNLNRTEEAINIANNFGDSDKVDAYFAISKALIEKKESAKVLEILDKISPIVEKSEYDKDKAQLSLLYAKLGKEQQSLKFANESLKNVVWKEGIMEFDHRVISNDIFDAYLILGKYDLANEILEKKGEKDEAKFLIKIGEIYLAKGNRKKADELFDLALKHLNPKEYGDSFDFGNLIDIYINLGEIEIAENLTKMLTGSSYMQQIKLLKIADFYIKKQNKSKATEILKFALEQTKKIDTSEAENGSLWTSGKWEQARYQSQIALGFINLQDDKKALQIISQLQKPYLRALILTEYVSVNKKRFSANKLSLYLEEALLLLKRKKVDIFDSKKFDVLAITARVFAEIGFKEKSTDVFAETLTLLDKQMIESGSDSSLLYAMCNIGVDFDNAKIKPNENLRRALRNIVKNWKEEKY